jgi:hypothetical protein
MPRTLQAMGAGFGRQSRTAMGRVRGGTLGSRLTVLFAALMATGGLEGWEGVRQKRRGADRTQDRDPNSYRLLMLTCWPAGLLALAGAIFLPRLTLPRHQQSAVFGAGLVLVGLGVGLRQWAIRTLGHFFVGYVTPCSLTIGWCSQGRTAACGIRRIRGYGSSSLAWAWRPATAVASSPACSCRWRASYGGSQLRRRHWWLRYPPTIQITPAEPSVCSRSSGEAIQMRSRTRPHDARGYADTKGDEAYATVAIRAATPHRAGHHARRRHGRGPLVRDPVPHRLERAFSFTRSA